MEKKQFMYRKLGIIYSEGSDRVDCWFATARYLRGFAGVEVREPTPRAAKAPRHTGPCALTRGWATPTNFGGRPAKH